MRTTLPKFLAVACLIFVAGTICAQTTATTTPVGFYNVTGYFFHPASPRAISQAKAITKVGDNTYQADVADLGGSGFQFQFQLDANNHLINWVAMGLTTANSGFMTADNPGNIVFPQSPQSLGYNSVVYNNTYDPVKHTIHMHYGYANGAGSANQNTYNRQVYETWVLPPPKPVVTSFSPGFVTEGTLLTVYGLHFTGATSVTLGTGLGPIPLSSVTVNDTVITGIVGKGANGPVTVTTPDGSASKGSINYAPPAISPYPWRVVGAAGFSEGRANFANIAAGPNNVPYVVYVDAGFFNKAVVRKLTGAGWTPVGGPVSDGACSNTNIVIDKLNRPWASYIDSANGNKVTVKQFDGSAWVTMGAAGFIKTIAFSSAVAIALDGNNVPYVLTDTVAAGKYVMNVFKLKNGTWVKVGTPGIKSLYGDASIAVDKTTNTPYIVSDDAATNGQIIVQKFDGISWANVGTPGFTTGENGIFYPDITIDAHGVPFISMQEDDGREEMSVYAFKNGQWSSVGNKFFSDAHVYQASIALDTSGTPFVLFQDYTNYQQGTVMQPNPNNDGTWQTVGNRGFATCNFFGQNALAITGNNSKYIIFADRTKNGRVTVMQYFKPVAPTITSFAPTVAPQGATVTIKGKNFTGAYAASFGGVKVDSGQVLSDTVAVVIVGNGASGLVTITTPAGTAEKAGFVFCVPSAPSVSITASTGTTICPGTIVKFTAVPVNAGNKPAYQWKKNGKNVGTNSTAYMDSTLKNGDSVLVVVTGNAPCATMPSANSNAIKFAVTPKLVPSISFTTNTGAAICPGTVVKFTAVAVNGGDVPVYAWRKNGKKTGLNSPFYTDSLLKNGDSVNVSLTSVAACAVPPVVASPWVKFTTSPKVKTMVTITDSGGTTICDGLKVTFTAAVINGGVNPAYQWIKNGAAAGINANTYMDSKLQTGDTVSVWVTTVVGNCSVVNPVRSNKMGFVVNPKLTPSITIATNTASTTICAATKVTFTAMATNGGAGPLYLWRKNGAGVSTSGNIYLDSALNNGDAITCTVLSSETCRTADTAISNKLLFTVQAGIPAAPSTITGLSTVKAGQAGAVYAVPKVTGVNTYAWVLPAGAMITAGQGTRSITVTWGSTGGAVSVQATSACGASAAVSKNIIVTPSFTGDGNTTILSAGIYPNPATNVASLQVTGYHGKVIVTITDMAGKVIKGKALLQNGKAMYSQQYLLALNGLSAGMYIVTVKDDTNIKSFKLVKAK